MTSLRLLIAESEPPASRARRRQSVGLSSGESYAATLLSLAPGARCDMVRPADAGAALPDRAGVADYDAVFLTGSPLHLYDDTPEARRQIDFMRAIFASGTPSFGSCAGLQVATVAAGGRVRPNRQGQEAGFARRITPTEAGRAHLLLAGRPGAYDALTIHGDEVESLPEGGTLLASNRVTRVQAAEIRCDAGVFWGVQYHPELSLREIAAALRRDAEELAEEGPCGSTATVEAEAALIEALDREPGRRDLAWRLGVDEEVTARDQRVAELRNAIEHLILPTRSRRGRE